MRYAHRGKNRYTATLGNKMQHRRDGKDTSQLLEEGERHLHNGHGSSRRVISLLEPEYDQPGQLLHNQMVHYSEYRLISSNKPGYLTNVYGPTNSRDK
jgi:hypothetical protein